MPDETPTPPEGSPDGRYLQNLLLYVLELTRRNTANTLDTIMTVSALIESLAGTDPSLGDAYQRNLLNTQATSPVGRTKQQVLAELDRIVQELKDLKV